MSDITLTIVYILLLLHLVLIVWYIINFKFEKKIDERDILIERLHAEIRDKMHEATSLYLELQQEKENTESRKYQYWPSDMMESKNKMLISTLNNIRNDAKEAIQNCQSVHQALNWFGSIIGNIDGALKGKKQC